MVQQFLKEAKNLATDFEKKYGKWEVFGAPLEEASTLGPCDFGNVTKCGLPTMKFFGGDGFGGCRECGSWWNCR